MQMPKRGRGRPKTGGRRPGWMGLRAALAVAVFQRERLAGRTERAARQSAVDECKRLLPGERMSLSEVGRALRHYQPRDRDVAWLFAFIDDAEALRRAFPPFAVDSRWDAFVKRIVARDFAGDPDTLRALLDRQDKAPAFVVEMSVGARPPYPSLRKRARALAFSKKYPRGA